VTAGDRSFRSFWHGRRTDAGTRNGCPLTAPEAVGRQCVLLRGSRADL